MWFKFTKYSVIVVNTFKKIQQISDLGHQGPRNLKDLRLVCYYLTASEESKEVANLTERENLLTKLQRIIRLGIVIQK